MAKPGNLPPIALTIAGSDSGGGAGIQADLKTFSAFGVYGASVITALTAQNTQGVFGIESVPPGFIQQQMRLVLEDIGADAIKTGMLGDVATIEAVATVLVELDGRIPIVVDPVMVAQSGDPLLDAGDILAHPFTRHPGGFVDTEGNVHPIVREALDRGLTIDVGHGSHFSIDMARRVLDAGIRPTTLVADMHG